MKLWGSVKQQAAKVAFEAERLVRIRREEGEAGDARKEINNQLLGMGQVALQLCRNGMLGDPQITTLAQRIAELEAKIKMHEDRIVAIRAEQPPEAEGAAPQAAPPTGPAAPATMSGPEAPAPTWQNLFPQGEGAPPAAPQAPAAPAVEAAARFCSGCGKPLPPGAVFCPECGTRNAA